MMALIGIAVSCVSTAEMQPVGSDSTESGTQLVLSAGDLEGTEWILASYGPSETPVKTLAKPEVTIRFHDYERMNGMAGCNTYAAQFKIDGHRFVSSEIEQTPFGCYNEAEWEQEMEYLAALSTANSIGLVDGLLTIDYQGGQLRFTPEPAAPATSLAGTQWRLISFETVETAQPIIPGTMITAAFVDGKIIGTAGCNEYKSAYVTRDRSFTVWEIIKRADPCSPEGVSAQEKIYIDALHSASSFTLDDNILTISHDEGALRFGKSLSANDTFLTEWLTTNTSETAHSG